MHCDYVCSIVHRFNRVFFFAGGGAGGGAVVLLCEFVYGFFSLSLFWGCFMIIVVLFCNS